MKRYRSFREFLEKRHGLKIPCDHELRFKTPTETPESRKILANLQLREGELKEWLDSNPCPECMGCTEYLFSAPDFHELLKDTLSSFGFREGYNLHERRRKQIERRKKGMRARQGKERSIARDEARGGGKAGHELGGTGKPFTETPFTPKPVVDEEPSSQPMKHEGGKINTTHPIENLTSQLSKVSLKERKKQEMTSEGDLKDYCLQRFQKTVEEVQVLDMDVSMEHLATTAGHTVKRGEWTINYHQDPNNHGLFIMNFTQDYSRGNGENMLVILRCLNQANKSYDVLILEPLNPACLLTRA